MKRLTFFFSLLLLAASCFAQLIDSDKYKETRYCGPPKRYADGSIARDWKVVSEYRKIHKCPSTGLYTGACYNWALNHVKPLACGGCDSVSNLTWMRDDVKDAHDLYERRIFALDPPIADTAACVFKITP